MKANEGYLSKSLPATDLKYDITLLSFDDKWRQAIKNFFVSWKSKLLELEQLEDIPIKDSNTIS
jgi:hypothetical protein